jgi:hypothetical protein
MGEFKCLHTSRSNYSLITPGEHLKPVSGKIYWHVDESSLTSDMDKYKVLFAFSKAFKVWEEVLSPIVFESTGDINQGQIVLKFKKNGDIGLPYQFEPETLAYAFAPQGTSLGIHSDIYFNDAYKWDEIHKPDSIELFKVVVHELGHTLNLGHQTKDITDIMYPIYQSTGPVVLNDDTRKGIYDLYKSYGVKSSVPTSSISTELKSFIKIMYRRKSDLARLSSGQLKSVINAIGVSIPERNSLDSKISIILKEINKF